MMSSPYTQDAFIASASVTNKPSFEYINENLNKKGLEKLLLKVYETLGTAKTAQLANALKDLGFRYATLAGVTISIEDLEVPEAKKGLLERAEKEIEVASKRYQQGEITEVERYTKVIDTWSETTVKLTEEVVKSFDRLNPIYMMAFSGARGNLSQVRQLVGMRGLMADSQGQIIDIPIKTNFREGLSVTEYIISSYGARKGLVDTALKTADSGYLTRRLVDVAQDVIITQDDCGTHKGVYLEGITEGDTQVVKLQDRIVSRTLQEDIKDAEGQVVYARGEVISLTMAQKIASLGYTRVFVRSGLTCESQFGICQKCYGWSLTTNRIVDMGEAIGIMAAQSIGEPGTQLTMRTFHTGGVFSGGTLRQRITADVAGTIVGEMPPLREIRTRHGDVVMTTTRDAFVKIKPDNGKKEIEVSIPFNTVLHFSAIGEKVEKDQLLGEYELGSRDAGRLTERATKDISTDVPGLLSYEGFEVDEKRDRQGNISRTATRSGTIWALSGDVYTLPASSQLTVDDGQWVMEGNTLAETLITTEFGGEVRLPENLETKTLTVDGESQAVITQGKELTVVIAAIEPSNAVFQQTKKEILWKVDTAEGQPEETYVIKTPHGSVIENGTPIAELIDNTAEVPCSGEIRYHDVDISEHEELLSPSVVYFIPEEIHTISKSSSLKSPGLKHGEFVKAHTELVPGIMSHNEGLLEIVEDGEIIHEMIIRPGELHRVTEVSGLKVEDGQIIEAGTEVAPGLVTKERHMVSLFYPQVASVHASGDDEDLGDDMEDGLFGDDDFFGEEIDATPVEAAYVDVLLRPVYEYDIAPHQAQITFTGPEEQDITLKAVTKLQYADREKVRHLEGGSLLKTQLVLSMEGQLSRLKGAVEVYQTADEVQTLRLVVLENLMIRRDLGGEQGHKMNAALQTLLMVKHGDIIEKKTPVVKTRVLAKKGGQIALGHVEEGNDISRLLVISKDHFESLVLPKTEKPLLQAGDYVRLGMSLSETVVSQFSGRVSHWDEEAHALVLHKGRPYLISPGTMLPVEDQTVTQQGDHIATLIYERQKTGDIVQGLPKVEELLEGRRPKERAFIASYEATAEVQRDEEGVRLFLISDERGREEVVVPLGANVLVETGERVAVGQRITDGSLDPHDILEVLGIEAVRTFLVDEVQRVYRSQGVDIADKHIEIIVRQMTRKIVVDDGGDTLLLPGEMIDHKLFEEAVRKAEALNQQLPVCHPVLLGITKASLNTESFISAASFQETTRVLTEAAVEGKKDILRGLKENVIIGRLIPAGTGFPAFKTDRDEVHEDDHFGSRSGARKPSAILEEIESMFGAPQITEETMAAFDGEEAQEALAGLSVMTQEEITRDVDSFGEIFTSSDDQDQDDLG